ncbi:hypothetical protein [Seonamhaeicola marinus]|uniref:DUF4258 domain-containing protein n=1 Tax=Seonamhaeicola marinus TaxID=1912246 RepID=A0A5D0HKP9_9FLAO|nr:hypothetical protein [Seonamhaeicola marinus]TYA71886.1 hypothetical protein FUA24_20260 [Seonamhaeicola marinus]
MKLVHRVGYYLGGFSIGLIVLMFFLSGKKVSCDYGPEARVLKNIRTKRINYTQTFITDSATINKVLKYGNVDFSKSEPHKEPCATYLIESSNNDYIYTLTIENCDSIANVIDFKESP